ncbi:TorF family putative porin [Sphingomonas psychrotolerans]|uniref:TorF family putative porin n=1 Tax=Sphingomonas psychrotolerans TaxID=1327635 RepID=A0ABU3N2X2_9SPHN|nr:TorF family putative porin [Sphingomonas psychrotolerans]MDT8758894.1 TorF family putative porin [Sphingomonas psychrotolerans]
MMRPISLLLAAGVLWLAASPAVAQVTVSGETEIVSDYRYRGVSLSNGKPALQGSAELDTGADFYLGGFASWVPHGGGPTAVELDASAGYRAAVGAGMTLDGGVSWYHYPGADDCDYAEATAALGWGHGGTSARGGIAWAPRQASLVDAAGTRRANLYGFAGVEQAIAGTPLSLSLDAGYESGAFDGAADGGKFDWKGGVAASRSGFTLSASYVGAVRPRAHSGERKREHRLVFALGRSL